MRCERCGWWGSPEAILKKSLFPVHRVAIIVASREAAIFFFPCCIETMWEMLRKKGKISRM